MPAARPVTPDMPERRKLTEAQILRAIRAAKKEGCDVILTSDGEIALDRPEGNEVDRVDMSEGPALNWDQCAVVALYSMGGDFLHFGSPAIIRCDGIEYTFTNEAKEFAHIPPEWGNPPRICATYKVGAYIPAGIRRAITEKHGGICAYCGEAAHPPHIDHITPRVKGGTNAAANLTLACAACNQSKGVKTLEQWRGKA